MRQVCHGLLHDPVWRPRWRWLWGAMFLTVGVAALSPGDVAPTLSSSDKFDHTLSFATLSAVGCLSLTPGRWRAAGVVASMLAYGAFIELAQTQISGRYGDSADFLADAVGVALGVAMAALARHWASSTRRKRPANPS